MTSTSRSRKPGEALPSELVREIRLRHHLSQEDLALRLGLKGGKSVISGWETGRATCEGPAAELLLLLFGEESTSPQMAALLADVDAEWKRARNYLDTWRQISAAPERNLSIDRAVFDKLFPGVAIPPGQHAHGFPMLDYDAPANVYRIGKVGWTGVVPVEKERAPYYLWTLRRGGQFVHRERTGEDDPMSVTGGHTHIGSLLEIALATTYFLRRLAERCGFEPGLVYRIQLDMEGMMNRGVVGYRRDRERWDFAIDRPTRLSAENRMSASISRTVADLKVKPTEAGLALVAELVSSLRPDLATFDALQEQLIRRVAVDSSPGRIGYLGFLKRRVAVVSLRGERVGLLAETTSGARFTYDADYLRRSGARPLSPTLPLDPQPYESVGLHPFFSNLLPEGARLDLIAAKRKVDRSDRFGLLMAVGSDMIGAVEVQAIPGSGFVEVDGELADAR